MCTVDVGISHDNDLVVTQLGNIKIFVNARSKSSDHRLDFCIAVNTFKTRLLHVQDLSAQRKNRLRRTASRCFC